MKQFYFMYDVLFSDGSQRVVKARNIREAKRKAQRDHYAAGGCWYVIDVTRARD